MKDHSISHYAKSFLTHPASLLVLTVSLFLGVVVPEDMFGSQFLTSLSAEARQHLPVARIYETKSNFPSISLLYFAVMPFVSPFIFFWSRSEVKSRAEDLREIYWVRPRVFYKNFLILLVSFVWSVPVFYLWNRGYDFEILPINSSRLA